MCVCVCVGAWIAAAAPPTRLASLRERSMRAREPRGVSPSARGRSAAGWHGPRRWQQLGLFLSFSADAITIARVPAKAEATREGEKSAGLVRSRAPSTRDPRTLASSGFGQRMPPSVDRYPETQPSSS